MEYDVVIDKTPINLILEETYISLTETEDNTIINIDENQKDVNVIENSIVIISSDNITVSTPTNLTGILKGNGINISIANPSVDYQLPLTSSELTSIQNLSGTNTGDENKFTIESKLGITDSEINAITNLSGTNTGDETNSSLKLKLGITN